MFHKRIILDGDSDSAAIIAALRQRCAATGLPSHKTEAVIAEVRGPLNALIRSGRVVTSVGGQFRASRQVRTDSAAITLDARFGVSPGLFTRLRKALWGRRENGTLP